MVPGNQFLLPRFVDILWPKGVDHQSRRRDGSFEGAKVAERWAVRWASTVHLRLSPRVYGPSTIGSTTASSVETHTSLHDDIKELKDTPER